MEENKIVDKIEPSLISSIWVEKWNFLVILMAVIIGIYERFNAAKFLELVLGVFLFTGVVLMGFIAIALHFQYYFRLERNRKIEIFADKIIISCNGQIVKQISINDIAKIIVCDRLRTYGYKSEGYDKYHNLFPSFADSFYYLILLSKNGEENVLTSLLDIALKKKIAVWYKQGLEHKYKFLPFLKKVA